MTKIFRSFLIFETSSDCAVGESLALWSTNIRKLTKDHKGYGSSANLEQASFYLKNASVHICQIRTELTLKLRNKTIFCYD